MSRRRSKFSYETGGSTVTTEQNGTRDLAKRPISILCSNESEIAIASLRAPTTTGEMKVLRTAVLLACLGVCSAFVPAAPLASRRQLPAIRGAVSVVMLSDAEKAYLEAAAKAKAKREAAERALAAAQGAAPAPAPAPKPKPAPPPPPPPPTGPSKAEIAAAKKADAAAAAAAKEQAAMAKKADAAAEKAAKAQAAADKKAAADAAAAAKKAAAAA